VTRVRIPIAALTGSRPTPDAAERSGDRRAASRKSVEVAVLYLSDSLTVDAVARDLSRVGLFVETELLDPVGTLGRTTVLTDGGPAVSFSGIVRRVVEAQSPDGLPPGLGVMFTAMGPDAARWLAGETLPQVRITHPHARLLVVGADPPPAICQLASDAVVVTGRVPAVEPFLESAAVVAAPVRTGGGMRRKVLHAMALARPVVTTTRGAHGVWNPAATPTMLIADDAAGIARHIVSLLDSPELRRTLGMHARAAVIAHHRRTQFADRVAALYESLRQPGVAA
jgi:hypothetical protein